MGLLAKLNLLTIGLIFLTAVAITAFQFTQQWRDEVGKLRTQGESLLAIIAELAEYGLYTSDRAYLEHILDSLGADPEVAYIAVHRHEAQVLAERRFAPRLAQDALPALAAAQFDVAPGRIAATEVVLDGQRYIELVAPVGKPKASTRMPPSEPADIGADAAGAGATAPIGVIRIGMSLEIAAQAVPRAAGRRDRRHRAARRVRDPRHAAADAAPRRADAPADARGARGRIGTARRLRARAFVRRTGPADAHVQPHDAEARRVAVGGRELPAHARGKGRAAHARAGGRDRARVQARAARHPDRPAQPVAAQPAAAADPRAGAARRHARRLPVHRLRSLQAHQRHAGPRRRRPAAAGDRAAADERRARIGHRRAPGRRRVRADPAGPRSGARDVRGDDGADARARRVRGAVPARGPDADAAVLDRRRALPGRRAGRRRPHQAGGHRDVRGQGRGPQCLPVLHGRHERARPAAAAARDRHAPRPDGRRVLPRLPAADRDADGPRVRRRGAAALARSRARRDRAQRVHPDRRGVRHDPGARRARAARRVPPGRPVAPAGHAAAPVGEPVGAAAAARQLALRRRGRAARQRPSPRATSTSRSPRA